MPRQPLTDLLAGQMDNYRYGRSAIPLGSTEHGIPMGHYTPLEGASQQNQLGTWFNGPVPGDNRPPIEKAVRPDWQTLGNPETPLAELLGGAQKGHKAAVPIRGDRAGRGATLSPEQRRMYGDMLDRQQNTVSQLAFTGGDRFGGLELADNLRRGVAGKPGLERMATRHDTINRRPEGAPREQGRAATLLNSPVIPTKPSPLAQIERSQRAATSPGLVGRTPLVNLLNRW